MKSLQDKIEQTQIGHASFQQVYDVLRKRIHIALQGGRPRISWVLGPSRVGKSTLIRALQRDYPEANVDGKRRIPLLVAPLSGTPTPTQLPLDVLAALRAPRAFRAHSPAALTRAMQAQLELAQTKVVAFDEASRLAAKGSKLPADSAGNWLKDSVDVGKRSDILFGVPRLGRLHDELEEVRLRSFKPIVWRPYDAAQPEQMREFLRVVRTLMNLFESDGWSFALPLDVIAPNCYLQAPGLVGCLCDFMAELARQLRGRERRPIDLDDFAAVAHELPSAGSPEHPPFQNRNVSPVEISRAYRHLLEANGMLAPTNA